MQKKTSKKIPAVLVLMIVGIFGTLNILSSISTVDIQATDGIKYTSAVTKTVYRINQDTGQYEVSEQDTTHNLLTNTGRLQLKNMMFGLTPQTANISMLAISNSTAPAVGDTALAGSNLMVSCGLGNVTAVKNHVNATAIDISWQWTNTCTNQIVNTTGIFNQTAAGIGDSNSLVFAAAALTSSTLQNTDKIQVNYTINVG